MEPSTATVSKKRKQPLPPPPPPSNENPFTGILTRKKTQKYFFHQNRSGASRKSRSFPTDLVNPGQKFAKLSDLINGGVENEDEDEDDDEIYHITIKDLRARRVSPRPPKGDGLGKKETPKGDCGLIDGKVIGSEKCGDFKEGLKEGSRVCEKEGLIGGKCDLGISKVCDDYRAIIAKEGLIGGNPNLIVSRVNLEKDGSIEGNPDLGISEKVDSIVGNPNLVALEKGGIEGNPNLLNCDVKVNGKGESLDGAKGDGEGRVSIEMSPNVSTKNLQCRSEENVQTTPPDTIVLVRQRVDQSVLQNKSAEMWTPPTQVSPCNVGSAEGKKGLLNPRRNLGLNPCSRLKLFKAPNSFSYRRMLPFLMDLAKDEPNVGALKNNVGVKNETDSEAKPLISSLQESIIVNSKMDEVPQEPVAPCKPLEVNIGSKEEENPTLHSRTTDSSDQQDSSIKPIICPFEDNLESPISEETHLGTPVSNDPKTQGPSADGGVVSLDTAGKTEDSIVVIDVTATPVNPKTSDEPSVTDATLSITSHVSPLAESNPEDIPAIVVHSSQLLKDVSPGPSGFGLARGILKRNPRGCRGICDCLNCASFRLNAEKAFEFSRNQWFEAEELATDLMKELSSLRCVLEKSVNGANDNAIVPVDQMQDICKRASSAEDIARIRLSQMNEDLHVHCRIKPLQRPRVTFSSNVQEKICEVTDLSR